MRYATILVTILAAVVAPARAQDATARIKAAQYALGMIRGPQRIDAINTMEYWGTGTDGRLAAKVTKENGVTAITFPMTAPLAGITMKITLNASDHVEKVETRTENGTVTETTYSDYKDLGEIQSDVLFPLHITQKQGGVQVLDLAITKTDPNNPYVVFPVPENVERPK